MDGQMVFMCVFVAVAGAVVVSAVVAFVMMQAEDNRQAGGNRMGVREFLRGIRF